MLTGTHPEYVSEELMNATEDYAADGGRLIYLGDNGYHWNVSYRQDEPWCVEVRKLNSGMRAWQARPSEYYLANYILTTFSKTGKLPGSNWTLEEKQWRSRTARQIFENR